MKRFELFEYDKETDRLDLEENRFVKGIASAFKKVVNFISKLKFGQKIRIPLRAPRSLRESYYLEEGGALAPLLGTYAEKVAAERLVFRLTDAGYDVRRGAAARTKKDAKETKKRLSKIFDDGKAGKPMIDPFPKNPKNPKVMNITPNELSKAHSYLDSYRVMGMDIGDRTFEELNLKDDSAFCLFDVIQAGQQGRDDSVDLVVEKYSPVRMRKKEMLFSLKAYMDKPAKDGYLEMLKDPMGFLLKVSSDAGYINTHEHTVNKLVPKIDGDGVEYFSRPQQEVMNALVQTYGKTVIPDELKDVMKAHSKMFDWIKLKQKEYQKTKGLGSTVALDLAKQMVVHSEEIAEAEEEFKLWQLSLWIRFFDVGLKSRKSKAQESFKRGVLEILDIGKDSPVLIAGYLDQKLGKVVTGRRNPSKDLKELMSIDMKDLDVEVTSTMETTGPALKKFGINEQMASSITIVLSHKDSGMVLYQVKGKLNMSNSVQWYAKVGDKTLQEGRKFAPPKVDKSKSKKKSIEKLIPQGDNTLLGYEGTAPDTKMNDYFLNNRDKVMSYANTLDPKDKKAFTKDVRDKFMKFSEFEKKYPKFRS